MAQSQQTKSPSMADAIARAKKAAAAVDRARAAGVQPNATSRRVFQTDLRVPNTRDAKWVQRGAIISLVGGILAIAILPDAFIIHWLAFSAMFALIFIGVPNVLLHENGTLAPAKLVGWVALLLFAGSMTAVAAGDTGNLWSWSPWMSQFYK